MTTWVCSVAGLLAGVLLTALAVLACCGRLLRRLDELETEVRRLRFRADKHADEALELRAQLEAHRGELIRLVALKSSLVLPRRPETH